MKNALNPIVPGILFLIAGVLFLLTTLLSESSGNLPIGICFIGLGAAFTIRHVRGQKNKP